MEGPIPVTIVAQGRLDEDLDLSRTIGCLHVKYPQVYSIDRAENFLATLEAVTRQHAGIPSNGLGYGVLRYLSPHRATRERLRAQPIPEVLFNYQGWVGRKERGDTWLEEASGVGHDLHVVSHQPAFNPMCNLPFKKLNLIARIIGEELQLMVVYRPPMYHAETIRTLVESTIDEIHALARSFN
jgi:non-ribosomal peptide synthase protein (TIGR01720 family)